MMPGTKKQTPQNLHLDPLLIDALKAAAVPRRLKRGETLIEQGSAASALYFVLAGRFTVFANGVAIAEIGAGEPVGEVAFFGGGTRSASVVAARASDVLELSRQTYEKVLLSEPKLSGAIIASLAERLRRSTPAAAKPQPRPAQILGVLPGGDAPLDKDALKPLIDALSADGTQVIHTPHQVGSDRTVADTVLTNHNDERVLLVCDKPAKNPQWAEDVLQNCDTVFVCLDLRRLTNPEPSRLEAEIAKIMLAQNVHLVLLRDPSDEISGTPDWLRNRVFGLHHHMKAGSKVDGDRIARLVSGKGLGVVFGGGGAFGTAHLAMLKALGEVGIEIDMVGGTSVGSAMAGAFAMGLSMDDVIDRFVDMFVTSGAATRYTLPFWSIMDHTHFDAQLQRQYGQDLLAEDLPINYFALAASLTRNAPVVLRQGPLWKLIRASSAIPAVFPPLVADDGEVFVDGGIFNNVPVDKMRELKAGPNLVLRLAPKTDWRVKTSYNALPGRGGAMRRAILGRFGGKIRFPSIASVMTRSLVVNSEMLQASVSRENDIFVDLERIPGMGFMDWEKGRALFDETYAKTTARLETLTKQHSGVDLLRALSETQ